MTTLDTLERTARRRVHLKLRLARLALVWLVVAGGLWLLDTLHPSRHFDPAIPLAGVTLGLGIAAVLTAWRLSTDGLREHWIARERARLAGRPDDLSR